MEAEDVEDETAQIAMNSELEQESLNNLFNDRQGLENELRLVEHEIEKHLSQTQQLLQNMSGTNQRSTSLARIVWIGESQYRVSVILYHLTHSSIVIGQLKLYEPRGLNPDKTEF